MTTPVPLSFGFPRMGQEAGDRRDFLPETVGAVAALGCDVVVETGLGSRMGYSDQDYLATSRLVRAGTAEDAFAKDVVVVLRSPDDRFTAMRPGAVLVSMLHYPTRPARVRRLLDLGIDAVSLDSIVDDQGWRLVENMRAVAWNGVDAAFESLSRTCPWITDPARGPLRATVIGSGTVGRYAIEAATKYGALDRDAMFHGLGLPGVQVTVLGRNITSHAGPMTGLLTTTDVLVDASQRDDPSRPLVPNAWLAFLPTHAVVCDLVVDPYLPDGNPPIVRGLEGIPAGDLDQWTFAPDDPSYCATIPDCVPTDHRRNVVSCRAWPGIRPVRCMRHYDRQLVPLLRTLVERAGTTGLRAEGDPAERALRRASLRFWAADTVPPPRTATAAPASCLPHRAS